MHCWGQPREVKITPAFSLYKSIFNSSRAGNGILSSGLIGLGALLVLILFLSQKISPSIDSIFCLFVTF